jgi:hypothetical protein
MGENTKLSVCLIICVKNKLFGNVTKPHELMHHPNSISESIGGNQDIVK